ncbi:unnamed protein product [Effrenium voratum]|nr:unnamed protein product [Effrenium voratum]
MDTARELLCTLGCGQDRPVYRGRFARHPGLRDDDILSEEANINARRLQEGRFQKSRFNESGKSKKKEVAEVAAPSEITDVDQALTFFASSRESRKERLSKPSMGSMDFSDGGPEEEDSISPASSMPGSPLSSGKRPERTKFLSSRSQTMP